MVLAQSESSAQRSRAGIRPGSRDNSIRLPFVVRDNVQQPEVREGIRSQARAWWQRRKLSQKPWRAGAMAGDLEVTAALRALPELVDCANLPNGVVELAIEGKRSHERFVFDIHDGTMVLVHSGSSVPWASIAGPREAWLLALRDGWDRDLRLTGDLRLAEGVLAALPIPSRHRAQV